MVQNIILQSNLGDQYLSNASSNHPTSFTGSGLSAKTSCQPWEILEWSWSYRYTYCKTLFCNQISYYWVSNVYLVPCPIILQVLQARALVPRHLVNHDKFQNGVLTTRYKCLKILFYTQISCYWITNVHLLPHPIIFQVLQTKHYFTIKYLITG